MRIVYCLFCFLFLSCMDSNHNYEMQEKTTTKQRMQIEICHNPESSSHKLECTADCFEPNLESYSFCWTLKKEDCVKPLEYQWQRENCYFFD